jgi:hypothetical protein
MNSEQGFELSKERAEVRPHHEGKTE